MKIDYTPQLDFNNVLIRPKRTVINSRSEVNLIRKFNFPNANNSWEGIPIIASNMDTTGTFEVYDVLSKHKILTCFHKFYTIEDFQNQINKRAEQNLSPLNPEYFMLSSGIQESQIDLLDDLINH